MTLYQRVECHSRQKAEAEARRDSHRPLFVLDSIALCFLDQNLFRGRPAAAMLRLSLRSWRGLRRDRDMLSCCSTSLRKWQALTAEPVRGSRSKATSFPFATGCATHLRPWRSVDRAPLSSPIAFGPILRSAAYCQRAKLRGIGPLARKSATASVPPAKAI